MKNRRIIPTVTTSLRRLWLKKLGGLEGVNVRNKEWLTLLKEDTRNSLMIEGYFVSKREISDILENPKYPKVAHKVLGYFDAAVATYELAFQQYKTGEFRVTKSIVRQIHSLMFRGDPHFAWTPGEWRKGPIAISGASVKNPSEFRVEEYIDRLVEIINSPEEDLTRKLAVAHAMFEYIHPFPDGNGRVVRILLNFILVGHGLPNVAIKGSERDKKIYIDALEEADTIVENILNGKRKNEPFVKPLIQLEDLINRSLAVAMDVIICHRYDKVQKLLSLSQVAKESNKPINSLRVACSQKKIICTSIEGGIKTHPALFNPPS
jgi:Fic family protein